MFGVYLIELYSQRLKCTFVFVVDHGLLLTLIIEKIDTEACIWVVRKKFFIESIIPYMCGYIECCERIFMTQTKALIDFTERIQFRLITYWPRLVS